MASLTPQAFAQRWGESTLSERSSYQQHFLDLCGVLGAPKPADVDPTGEFYTFEKGVEKTGGGKGFADGLRDRGVDPQEAAHFLNKLLFCLFAEDILENLLALNLERSGD